MLNHHFSKYADYVVASPRKFTGVPDGGLLLAQNGASLPSGNLTLPPPDWWLNALKASQLRAEFDSHGGSRRWFELFRETEHYAPAEPSRMSELSSFLLDRAFDFEYIAAARRRNFNQLAAAFPELALFRELPKEVVPLGFPLRLRERDKIRRQLIECEIYPPVHWLIQDFVPVEFQASQRLSQAILTLPCDQRCASVEIDRLIHVLQSLHPKPLC